MNLPDFLAQDAHGYMHLTGHRIGLRHVIQLYTENHTPEMIHEHFPTVPLSLVDQVISFYLANKQEVDAYVQSSQKAIEQLAAAAQPGPSATELRRRMERQERESA